MLGLGIGSFVEAADFASRAAAPFINTKSLDGDISSSNSVNTQYDPQTLLRSAHSWSMWLKPDDGRPSVLPVIFGQSNVNDTTEQYYLMIQSTGALRLVHYSGTGSLGSLSFVDTAVIFSDGAQSDFTHIAIAADYSSTDVDWAFYANGSVVSHSFLANFKVTVSSANGYLSSGNTLGIDGRQSNPVNTAAIGGFDGLIDEFAAFTKTLSSSEVTAIYNSGTPTDLTGHDGLELYYRFEDNLTDTAGTSDGAAVGSVTFSSTTP